MVNLTFLEISNRMRRMAFPPVDRVVGIRSGGVTPAAMVAHQLGLPLDYLSINYRDESNQPRYEEPLVQETPFDLPAGSRLLLVDDVSVSGKTLRAAAQRLAGHHLTTFTLKGRAADLVLFPEIAPCVQWPWKPERR